MGQQPAFHFLSFVLSKHKGNTNICEGKQQEKSRIELDPELKKYERLEKADHEVYIIELCIIVYSDEMKLVHVSPTYPPSWLPVFPAVLATLDP